MTTVKSSRESKGARLRQQAIAAIHVGRRQLAMDEDSYRAMLARISVQHGRAVRSSADLDDRQRQAVLDELRRLGATHSARKHHVGKPHNFASKAMPELIKKIDAMLADMKLPWSYADAIGMQQTGVARVSWIRDDTGLRAIVAALSVEQEKRALCAAIDARLASLGWDAATVVETLRPLRPNWRRHRPSLKLVLDYLGTV